MNFHTEREKQFFGQFDGIIFDTTSGDLILHDCQPDGSEVRSIRENVCHSAELRRPMSNDRAFILTLLSEVTGPISQKNT